MIISIDAFTIKKKNSQQLGIKRTHLNLIKAIYDMLTGNIILSDEIMKVFSFKSRPRQ